MGTKEESATTETDVFATKNNLFDVCPNQKFYTLEKFTEKINVNTFLRRFVFIKTYFEMHYFYGPF